MSSENKPRYARIGFTVLVCTAAIAATLVYLGGFGGKDMQVLVESYYDNPVSGLSTGSAVNFRGVKIGEVRDIMLVGRITGDSTMADAQRVRMVMALDLRKLGARERPDDAEIRSVVEKYVARGLRATVASSGITGLSRIELNMLADPPPAAKLAWHPRYPVIPPAPSLMDNFADVVTRVVNHMDRMDFSGVWSNVQNTAESAARLVDSVGSLIESRRADAGAAVENIRAATEQAGELFRKLTDDPSLLLRPSGAAPLPETAR